MYNRLKQDVAVIDDLTVLAFGEFLFNFSIPSVKTSTFAPLGDIAASDNITGTEGIDLDSLINPVGNFSAPAPLQGLEDSDFPTLPGFSVTKTIPTFPAFLSDPIALGDEITGTTGNDVIQGTSGRDIINGLAGNDTIYGNGGYDEIYGGSFADVIYGNGSSGQFYGGPGDDVIYGSDIAKNHLYGDQGDDTLYAGDVTFIGASGDYLTGGAGSDILIGGNGNDKLFFDEFDSVIDGGIGNNDFAYYRGAITVWNDLSILQNIENIYLNQNASNTVDFTGSTVLHDFWLNGGNLRDIFNGTHERDKIDGGNGADIIYGKKGDDWLRGGAARDKLYGNLGNDSLFGENGSDLIYGGFGDDYIVGGVGNDHMYGEAGVDSFYGEAGDDKIFGDAEDIYANGGKDYDTFSMAPTTLGINLEAIDIENILLSNGDDILDFTSTATAVIRTFDGNDSISGNGSAHIYAGQGDDFIRSGSGYDTLFFVGRWGHDTVTDFRHGVDLLDLSGSSPMSIADLTITQDGNDTLIQAHLKSIRLTNTDARTIGSDDFIFDTINTINGTFGDDIIQGTANNDIIYSSQGMDTVYGNGGDDKIFDIEGNIQSQRKTDWLYGGDGNDTIVASYGNDRLFGGNGNDTLYGTQGTNLMEGGDGDDVIIGHGTLKGGAGADYLDGSDGSTVYADDEDIFLSGLSIIVEDSSFHHVFINTHVGGLTTTDGNDYVDISGNNASYLNIRTGKGDDIIIGSDGRDQVYAGEDNDTITTGTAFNGDDFVYFFNNWGNDVITDFDSRDDTLDVSGADVLGLRDLTITQDGLDTLIVNTEGSIRLLNFDKANLRFSDFVFAAATVADEDEVALSDVFEGTSGADDFTGKSGSDQMFGRAGDDILRGAAGDDFIYGNGGDDKIQGGGGNDKIHGGTGDDVIHGGDGDDNLYGNADNDILTGGSGADTFHFDSASDHDTITDFTDQQDIISIKKSNIDEFSDLIITQDGADTLITFGDDSIRLLNTDIATIDANDFNF